MLIPLFSNRATVGNGDGTYWPGGDGLLQVDGAFGGTTFKLQLSVGSQSAFKDLDSSVSFTAAAAVIATLPAGWIRGVLTGGNGMALNASMARIEE